MKVHGIRNRERLGLFETTAAGVTFTAFITMLPLLGCAPQPSGQSGAASAAVDELSAAVREAVTSDGLEEHTRAIVEHERPSGSPGENAAIDHIVEVLTSDGVPVEDHTFQGYASDPVSASVEVPATSFSPEAITVAFSASVQGLEAPLVDVGTRRDLPPLELGTGERLVLAGEGMGRSSSPTQAPQVTDAIALVDGQPSGSTVQILAHLGAAGIIFVNSEERLVDLIVTTTWGTPSLANYHRLPSIPVAEVTKSAGERLRGLLAKGPVRVRLTTETRTGWKPLRLAVARIPGPSPDAPFVLFGGHIDGWYHGATDEGASNALMLELARAFYKNRENLRRGLIVAWWPGHSNARYGGSTWFADHYFEELRKRCIAYLNVDVIGQIDSKRFGAATTVSLADLATRVVGRREGEEIQPRRPGRNSDQSFNGVGLPLLQFHHSRSQEDGGYWFWHTPEDTIDKVDFQILKRDADLYADAIAELLTAPRPPVDLTTEVHLLGEAIAERQAAADGRFDLQEAAREQARLLELVQVIQERLPGTIGTGSSGSSGSSGSTGVALDLALIRVLRPLHRVLYVPLSPYHPDPGVGWTLLPGLAATKTLAEEEPETDRYRFAETTLVRERNRLLEALDEALDEAVRLRETLY